MHVTRRRDSYQFNNRSFRNSHHHWYDFYGESECSKTYQKPRSQAAKPPYAAENPRPPYSDANRRPPFDYANRRPPFHDANRRSPFRDANRRSPFRDANRRSPFRDANRRSPFRDANCRPPFKGANRHPPFDDGNRRPPFIPRFPVNFSVTIPNFSGVSPPDLFVFGNSDKSIKFPTSSPGHDIPRSSWCSPVKKDARSNLKKSNETEINDDVQYLYTVLNNGGEFVEVDLSEDSEGPCFRASDHFLVSNASPEIKESGKDKMTGKGTVPSSEKQDAAHRKGRKRKKSSEDLHCDICECEYEIIRSKGEEIFKARCGHMFCQKCLKELDPCKCPECNLYLQKLCKVII